MKKIHPYVYLFTISIIFDILCGYFVYSNIAFTHNSAPIVWVVSELQWKNGENGRMCSPVISYFVQGKEYIHMSNMSSSPCPYEKWEKVDMLYNLSDPNDAVIDWFFERWLIVTVFLSLASIVSIVWLLLYRKEKKKQWLMANGIAIEVPVTGVIINTSYRVNGKSPWIIMAQYDDGSGKIYAYKSENIWFDPSKYTGRAVSVLVNPTDYSEYYMNTSFLPELMT